MAEQERNAALLFSLRGVVRGLSAIFWGLPVALVLSVQTAVGKGDWLRPLGFAPVVGVMALLCYGTFLLGGFQRQERVWMQALERARVVAVINVGLAPFLFFWSKMPSLTFFTITVEIFFVLSLVFLYLLNTVLLRLSAMLPDETLRSETRIFTKLNRSILTMVIVALPIYFTLRGVSKLPRVVAEALVIVREQGPMLELLVVMLFILLPVAMTMALVWKIKEVILSGVFSALGNERSV
jgi:hypothetical protein